MAKSARDKPAARPTQRQPVITEDDRLKKWLATPDGGTPVRTVLYVEVGTLADKDVKTAMATIQAMYDGTPHPTFVVPCRGGKVNADVVFEKEILDMVHKLCVVVDGEIQLKDGWKDVQVLRQAI